MMRNSPNSVGRRASANRSTVFRFISRERGAVEFSRQHSWFESRRCLWAKRRSPRIDVLALEALSIYSFPFCESNKKLSPIKLVTQAGKSQRAERQSKISQSDIEVAGND